MLGEVEAEGTSRHLSPFCPPTFYADKALSAVFVFFTNYYLVVFFLSFFFFL